MKFAFSLDEIVLALTEYRGIDLLPEEIATIQILLDEEERPEIIVLELTNGKGTQEGLGVESSYGDFDPLGDAGDCGGSEAGASFGRVCKQSKQDEKSDS